jgi:hypothetical protein
MGITTCTKTTGDSLSNQEFPVGGCDCEVLLIGVDGHTFRALNPNGHQALDCVVSGTAAPNDYNPSLPHITSR